MSVAYVGNLALPQMTLDHRPWHSEINDAWEKIEARLAGTSTGMPTATGFFVGQRNYDKTNGTWYTCTATAGPTWTPDYELPGMRTLPAGVMVGYGGATAPAGWLLCDGSAVSRATYAALFAAIGTAYGNGDGTTTFNLPDRRGRVEVGRDNMGGTAASRVTGATASPNGNTLGANGGAQVVALSVGHLPAHSHSGEFVVVGAGSFGGDDAGSSLTTQSGTGDVGSGQAHPNMPPFVIANVIIKV